MKTNRGNEMRTTPALTNATLVAGLLALAGSLCAAEHPRYGAEDFLPTPQTPIGFQAEIHLRQRLAVQDAHGGAENNDEVARAHAEAVKRAEQERRSAHAQ